jgi:hypothetical protein
MGLASTDTISKTMAITQATNMYTYSMGIPTINLTLLKIEKTG